MQLVDQGRLDLDAPLASYLAKPLPSYGPDPVFPDKYGPYKDLASDPRWRKITARMCLTHSTGFSNFWFIEPDQKLRIHFDPGTRFSYSGEGFILLQFVIEKGLGLDLGALTQANFERLGMSRTSLVWRDSFAANLADGWNDQGKAQEHDQRSKVRAAGSMDTTIADLARFALRADPRRRTEAGLSRRTDAASAAHPHRPPVPALRTRAAPGQTAERPLCRPRRDRL